MKGGKDYLESLQSMYPEVDLCNYDQIKSELVNTPTEVRYIPTVDVSNTLAYCRRARGDEGSYVIFIDNAVKGMCRKFLYMHEYGHIKFNHLRNQALCKKLFNELYQNSISYFRSKINIPSDLVSDEDLLNYLYSKLDNMACDFEVNSKLFTETEWITCCINLKSLGVHPAQHKLPNGLTNLQYIRLMMNRIEEFIDKFINEINNQLMNGSEGESDDSNSMNGNVAGGSGKGETNKVDDSDGGSQDSSDNSEPDRSNSRPDFSEYTKEEIRDILDSWVHGNIIDDIEDTVADESLDDTILPGDSHQDRELSDVELTQSDIINNIIKFLQSKSITNGITNNRNVLYNYNRRKFGSSNIIIPRVHNKYEIETNNIIFLLDCSSSMDTEFLVRICNSISKFYKDLHHSPNSIIRLIGWDTDLVIDIELNKLDYAIQSGGGTRLSKGIDYIHDMHYDKPNTIIFILSDLGDNLTEWDYSCKSINADKIYAINISDAETKKYSNFEIYNCIEG